MILALTCATLVSGCGAAIDLSPEAGWTGGAPKTEQEFAMAVLADQVALQRANVKLELARKKYQRGY